MEGHFLDQEPILVQMIGMQPSPNKSNNQNVIKYGNPIVIKYGTPVTSHYPTPGTSSNHLNFIHTQYQSSPNQTTFWANTTHQPQQPQHHPHHHQHHQHQDPLPLSTTTLAPTPPTPAIVNQINNEEEKIEIQVTRDCLVCHYPISINSDLWRDAYNDFTSTSFKLLSDVIRDLMKEINQDLKLKTTSIVCMNCFLLIDRLDDLQKQFEVMYLKYYMLIYFYIQYKYRILSL